MAVGRAAAWSELFALLALGAAVGVVGAAAWNQRVRAAREAEAKSDLGALIKGNISFGGCCECPPSLRPSRHLCSTPARPRVPDTVPRAGPLTVTASDWRGDDPTRGWACLRFEKEGPMWHQLGYTGEQRGALGTAEASAWLDEGNGGTVVLSFGSVLVEDRVRADPDIRRWVEPP